MADSCLRDLTQTDVPAKPNCELWEPSSIENGLVKVYFIASLEFVLSGRAESQHAFSERD
jgi:hypothetical protein